MNIRFIFSCLILFSISFACQSNDLLKVAIPPAGYPPYIIIDDDHINGILIETLKHAAQASNLELEFIYASEQHARDLLDAKEIDVRMESPGFVDNPKNYLWSDPVTSIKDLFVFHRLTPNVFEHDESLAGSEINTHIGYAYPTLQLRFENGQLKRNDFKTERAMLFDLIENQNGVSKAAVMDQYVVKYLMLNIPTLKSNLVLSRRHIDYKYLHFQFNKSLKMRQILTKLNFEIKKFKRSGAVDKIIKKNVSGI
ncbi:substrate-binding periplasmic protein [Pseudomonas sp. HK3]|jgi:polar amino acid transport system substrate-binding protein